MIVVPLYGDKVKTSDGLVYRVTSYTNFKDNGPAVYCRNRGDKSQTLIYFFDIASINGTKVEYSRAAKLFTALGRISREQNLPQPDDQVVVMSGGEKKSVKVESLRLKSKILGINRGIFIKDTEGNAYRLKNIIDISPSMGTHRFNRRSFISVYDEYLGV